MKLEGESDLTDMLEGLCHRIKEDLQESTVDKQFKEGQEFKVLKERVFLQLNYWK
jgi:hypothetical protein